MKGLWFWRLLCRCRGHRWERWRPNFDELKPGQIIPVPTLQLIEWREGVALCYSAYCRICLSVPSNRQPEGLR